MIDGLIDDDSSQELQKEDKNKGCGQCECDDVVGILHDTDFKIVPNYMGSKISNVDPSTAADEDSLVIRDGSIRKFPLLERMKRTKQPSTLKLTDYDSGLPRIEEQPQGFLATDQVNDDAVKEYWNFIPFDGKDNGSTIIGSLCW